VSVDDKFCSPPCLESDLHPPIGDEEYLAAYRNRYRSKKTWAAYQKAKKKRQEEYLKKEMAFQQQARKAKGLPAWDEGELRRLLLDNW
jgi:hypothetical protein